ncbi:RluA family pseudouridine synthase [Litchfieldia salsa]|uniref:Pseudouridine synthase n=1 Tax=Litchfieldia salsa TaxID=930152 RepID=A0A1H0S467_9BACI|nr:23S rRNA pseudouridine1911/1915/1917 synthase [Litchfieldia salsa]
MAPFTLEWKIKEDESNYEIKEFLKINHVSKIALTDIKFKGGSIIVNNEVKNVRYKLQVGDHLKVIFPTEVASSEMIPTKITLNIVYEDQYLLVINKQPYLPTIPSRDHPTNSLANGLLYYYQQIGLKATTHIVNRLDRDTSGLLVVAKYRHVHHLFVEQQKQGTLKREYEAITHGQIHTPSGTIDAPIGRNSGSIIERTVRDDGQPAITHYQIIQVLSEKDMSHVAIQLETGRTHQIRVHLTYVGHPLVGDDLYGGSTKVMKRQALHCRRVSFVHPITNENHSFTAELPIDMKNLLLY